MSKDVAVLAKKAAKYAGAFAVGTGVFALSALVASGAAVGAVAEGFKAAGSAAKKVLKEAEEVEVTAEDEGFDTEETLTEDVSEEAEMTVEEVVSEDSVNA